jgi:DNA-binding XRE family transcriptional regulator
MTTPPPSPPAIYYVVGQRPGDALMSPGIVVAPNVLLIQHDDGQLGLHFVEGDLSVGQLSMEFNTNPPQIPSKTEMPITRAYSGLFRSVPIDAERSVRVPDVVENVIATRESRSKKYPGLDNRLRDRRATLGITFAELARLSGVSEKTIRNYENGTDPNIAYLGRLCPHLSCDLNWLLYGEEEELEHGNDGREDPGGRAAGR